jgi:hypothetical protein
MLGKTKEEVEKELKEQGKNDEEIQKLVNHKVFNKNIIKT